MDSWPCFCLNGSFASVQLQCAEGEAAAALLFTGSASDLCLCRETVSVGFRRLQPVVRMAQRSVGGLQPALHTQPTAEHAAHGARMTALRAESHSLCQQGPLNSAVGACV